MGNTASSIASIKHNSPHPTSAMLLPHCAFTPAPRVLPMQPRQLDVLQEQVRAGQLVAGWPMHRRDDQLYCYLTRKLQQQPTLAFLLF